jgi:hypothetical protein
MDDPSGTGPRPQICDCMERIDVGSGRFNVYLHINRRQSVDVPTECECSIHRVGWRPMGCGNRWISRVHLARRYRVGIQYDSGDRYCRTCVEWNSVGWCCGGWKYLFIARRNHVDRCIHTQRLRMASRCISGQGCCVEWTYLGCCCCDIWIWSRIMLELRWNQLEFVSHSIHWHSNRNCMERKSVGDHGKRWYVERRHSADRVIRICSRGRCSCRQLRSRMGWNQLDHNCRRQRNGSNHLYECGWRNLGV